jgi:hypothetical protein
MTQTLITEGYINEPPPQMLQDAIEWAIKEAA